MRPKVDLTGHKVGNTLQCTLNKNTSICHGGLDILFLIYLIYLFLYTTHAVRIKNNTRIPKPFSPENLTLNYLKVGEY